MRSKPSKQTSSTTYHQKPQKPNPTCTVQTSKFGRIPHQLATNLLPLPPNALPLHPVLIPHPSPSARPTVLVNVPRVTSQNAIRSRILIFLTLRGSSDGCCFLFDLEENLENKEEDDTTDCELSSSSSRSECSANNVLRLLLLLRQRW